MATRNEVRFLSSSFSSGAVLATSSAARARRPWSPHRRWLKAPKSTGESGTIGNRIARVSARIFRMSSSCAVESCVR